MFSKTYIATYKIEITDEGKSSLNSLLPLAAHLRFNWKPDFSILF